MSVEASLILRLDFLAAFAIGSFVLIKARIDLSRRFSESSAESRPKDWFHTLLFFIPKTISEPWLGDILEKRKRMTDERYSTAAVECMTMVNLVLLAIFWILRVVVDILTPFKAP